LVIGKNQIVGEIEEDLMMDRDDPVWEEWSKMVARMSEGTKHNPNKRKKQIEEQLLIGSDCSSKEWDTMCSLNRIKN